MNIEYKRSKAYNNCEIAGADTYLLMKRSATKRRAIIAEALNFRLKTATVSKLTDIIR
jgi:hypothetical protein